MLGLFAVARRGLGGLRGLSVPAVATSSYASYPFGARGLTSVAEPAVGSARQAFEAVWARLVADGRPLIFPKEIIWLNGAPGSGKTRNSRFMMETRGYGHDPIVMSQIIAQESPAVRAAIDAGRLVDDEIVLESLLTMLLQPQHRSGALVDGFPRTPAQVECLPMLRDKMRQLRKENASSDGTRVPRPPFPAPRFFVCILYVGREESVRRQLLRGQHARRHNDRVRMTGTGILMVERPTDSDSALIQQRYGIFEQHRGTLLALRQHFPFSVIDAERPIDAVQRQILKQFRYQSNQELRATTFCAIDQVPLAKNLRFNARDALVTRLDEYDAETREQFTAALAFVKDVCVPACRRAAFCGSTSVRVTPEDDAHGSFMHPAFATIVVDVLAERGYAADYLAEDMFVPASVNLFTGAVVCERRTTHVVNISFPKARLTGVTNGNSNDEVATRG